MYRYGGRMLDAGYWMLVTASAEREAGYWMLVTASAEREAGCWIRTTTNVLFTGFFPHFTDI